MVVTLAYQHQGLEFNTQLGLTLFHENNTKEFSTKVMRMRAKLTLSLMCTILLLKICAKNTLNCMPKVYLDKTHSTVSVQWPPANVSLFLYLSAHLINLHFLIPFFY